MHVWSHDLCCCLLKLAKANCPTSHFSIGGRGRGGGGGGAEGGRRGLFVVQCMHGHVTCVVTSACVVT